MKEAEIMAKMTVEETGMGRVQDKMMISSALLERADGQYNTNFYAVIGFAAAALVMWGLLNIASRKSE